MGEGRRWVGSPKAQLQPRPSPDGRHLRPHGALHLWIGTAFYTRPRRATGAGGLYPPVQPQSPSRAGLRANAE